MDRVVQSAGERLRELVPEEVCPGGAADQEGAPAEECDRSVILCEQGERDVLGSVARRHDRADREFPQRETVAIGERSMVELEARLHARAIDRSPMATV